MAFGVVLAMVLGGWLTLPPSAQAAERPAVVEPRPAHDHPVSPVPVSWTPQILDGRTADTVQVGDSMVVGGDFTQVAPSSGSPVLNRTGAFAFSAVNGAVNTSFGPSVSNGQVRAVESGPLPDTVYLAGSFQGVNGVTRKIVLVNITTGQLIPDFTAPWMNGAVNDVQRVGNRLYVGGVFTLVEGQPHNGLVALNATTGAREDFLSVALTENHNYTGEPGQARAPVGAKKIAVTPQGDQLAVIGNFRKADGLERRQMVLIDLTGAAAAVRSDWRTNRFGNACANNAFDSYVRGVDSSPDGSYFTVGTTGGPFPGSLCDTVTRWDVAATGEDIQPTWIDDTGGDTILSVTSSGSAIYAGGHQRWMNNHGGRDFPAPGAVPRPGLGALEVGTGLPLSWNPGRSPRGVGAESVYVSDAGLWVGSDTEKIGHWTYHRPRIAFFPVSGGTPLGDGDTGALPGNVYKGGDLASGGTNQVLYRVNAGGPALASFDGGPGWAADDGTSNPYRNEGSRAASWSAVSSVDSTVPGFAPSQLFESERWDSGSAPEMAWNFPVESGREVEVRLYFANRCGCTSEVGERVFDVRLEGQTVLQDYDIVADAGDQVGTMEAFTVTSDGAINLEWLHKVENPLVNGIEIVEKTESGELQLEPTGLSRVWFEGTEVTEPEMEAPSGEIDWAQVRGSVVIDGVLFYGTSDRELMKRTFDGTTYGPATMVDPYNDPYWSGIQTGSGQTYTGVTPSFYNDIAAIAGMAYYDGRLYYTRAGSNRVYSRAFVPDSGVLTQAVREVPVFTTLGLGGIFFDENAENLYFVTASTGTLSEIGWNGSATVGDPIVMSGPEIDGIDWGARAVFLADGPPPAPNEAPVAVLDAECDRLVCQFSGVGSSDSDGSVVSYAWDFGDGGSSSEAEVAHTFAEGSYTVTLTVTDNRGAVGTVSSELVVEANQVPVAVMGEPVCDRLECVFDGVGSSDPDDSIVSYVWDFGDGSDPVEGVSPSHVFGVAGAYTVTLTVMDEFGATGSVSMDLEVLANNAPVAVIGDPVCGLLECSFDGAGSSDPDTGDSVVSYLWDFGDGSAPVEGVSVAHTFAAAGDYVVSLTVADGSGATGSVTHELSVSDGSAPVTTAAQLVDQVAVMREQVANPGVTVPSGVQADDLLVLFVTTNFADEAAGPDGVGAWDLESRTVSGPLAVSVFTKVADGSEADQSVSMTWPTNHRTDLTMLVYRGVGDAGVEVLESVVDARTDSYASPVVEVPGEQRVALSLWADRSSSTTAWTAPPGVDVVSTQVGTGGGRVSSLMTAETVDAGSYGGLVASTDAAGARGVAMTLLLTPNTTIVGPPVNEAPVAVLDAECDRLVCQFSGVGSSDSDGSVVSYAWDFGDGGSSSEAEVAHTFAEGSYTVTLTVTDNRGAVGTVSSELVVEANQVPVAVMGEPVCDRLECVFDGVGSSDPDDSIVSYVWDFGDGSDPVEGVSPSHVFGVAGAYTVTLTVMDEFGATGSVSMDLEVLANNAPVAVIGDPVCGLLECSFDGAGSSDPDTGDSVVSYLWDFGDGSAPVEGVSVAHTFAAAGDYVVSLTVADGSGATGSVTHELSVSDGSAPVTTAAQLVDQVAVMREQVANPGVTVPSGVQADDLLVLFVTTNFADEAAGPDGVGAWDLESRTVSGPLAVSVFTKVADGSEADQSVSMTWPTNHRTDLTMLVYRGVGDAGVEVLESVVDARTDSYASPVVEVPGEQRVALSLWADRSSSTTAWTAPPGVDVVSTQVGTGGGRVSSLMTAETVDAGSYGGLVASTDAAGARGVAMTLLLTPNTTVSP